jgi:hypothetical protein
VEGKTGVTVSGNRVSCVGNQHSKIGLWWWVYNSEYTKNC